MKLLLIHNFYRSQNIGGEDVVFRDELHGLRKKLGEENVISYSVSNDKLSSIGIVFTIWFSWIHFFKVFNLVRREKIEIVHVHNFFPMLTPSVFLAAKLSGAKVVHTLHNYRLWCVSGILYRGESGICELCVGKLFPLSGIRYACYRGSVVQSLIAQFAFNFYRVFGFFQAVDFFFVLTNFQRKKLISYGLPEARILQKPNGVSFSSASTGDKSGFLYVGRFEAAKGIESLLDAWVLLDLSFALTLVGGGERAGELRKKYPQSNIIFMGDLPRESVVQKMAQSKYLLQTSLMYETFGLTMIEAMSVGTPVIGFNIGTRSEVIEDGKNGFLSESGLLKEAVQRAAQADNYSELSANALITAKKYEKELVLSRQIELYGVILAQ
jgi:glycosyltransferase involved in cell wall biosynthesis